VHDHEYIFKKTLADFSTMNSKLGRKMYPDIESFMADANLIFDNCFLYNPEDSIYVRNARKLAKFLKDMVAEDKKLMKLED
jgi:histone acetyltransferase